MRLERWDTPRPRSRGRESVAVGFGGVGAGLPPTDVGGYVAGGGGLGWARCWHGLSGTGCGQARRPPRSPVAADVSPWRWASAAWAPDCHRRTSAATSPAAVELDGLGAGISRRDRSLCRFTAGQPGSFQRILPKVRWVPVVPDVTQPE
jgi:hypothetical protein